MLMLTKNLNKVWGICEILPFLESDVCLRISVSVDLMKCVLFVEQTRKLEFIIF